MHPKQVIRAALESHRGDNLFRAQSAFRGMTPAQMNEQYGASGKTRQQIIDEYQQHEDDCTAAMRWLETKS